MAWSIPRTWNPGEVVTAALMNAHVRDNMNVLKTRIGDDGRPRLRDFASAGVVSNSGTAETTLYSFSVLANQLIDGDAITLEVAFDLAANTNAKTVRLDIAGQKLTLFTTAVNVANNRAQIRFTIFRSGVGSARITGVATYNAANGAQPANFVHHCGSILGSLNWAALQQVNITAQGGASADVSATYFFGTMIREQA